MQDIEHVTPGQRLNLWLVESIYFVPLMVRRIDGAGWLLNGASSRVFLNPKSCATYNNAPYLTHLKRNLGHGGLQHVDEAI